MSGQPGGAIPGTLPLEGMTFDKKEHERNHDGYEEAINAKGEKFQFEVIDAGVEKKLLRKIDRNILILFFLIYGMQYVLKLFC
jgi:hypothetical protein